MSEKRRYQLHWDKHPLYGETVVLCEQIEGPPPENVIVLKSEKVVEPDQAQKSTNKVLAKVLSIR